LDFLALGNTQYPNGLPSTKTTIDGRHFFAVQDQGDSERKVRNVFAINLFIR
jgi:hypothetical protein